MYLSTFLVLDTCADNSARAIFWVYNTGFPKAENIAKAIDKRLGVQPEVVGERLQNGAKFKLVQREIDNGGFNDPNRTSFKITRPVSAQAKALAGFFGGCLEAVEGKESRLGFWLPRSASFIRC